MDMDKEAALIARAQNGDESAFVSLIETHYDRIYRTAFRWLGQAADAEDVAQEVCVKLARVLKQFRGTSRFSTWITRITINASKDHYRKRKAHQPLEDVENYITDESPSPEASLERAEIWRQVQLLPEKERDAILLVYAEGLSHAEAAEILNCKEKTVSWYIHEAKTKLKGTMSDE